MRFERLEARKLLSAEAFAAAWADMADLELSSAEMAEVVASYDLDDAYAATDWQAENYWFSAADGEVFSLWHGGAVHDPDGDGEYAWELTSITRASGVGMNLQPGSISGEFTPWRALNIVGLDHDGNVRTYWWSPEAGARGLGVNGNGWTLTNLNNFTDFDGLGGDDMTFTGATETRMRGRTIQIIVDDGHDDDMKVVMSFTPGRRSDDGSPWVAERVSAWDLDDGDDDGGHVGYQANDHHDDGDDDDDLMFVGDTTIAADEIIDQDITIVNGTLTVLGAVTGDIVQVGDGSVVVDGGQVTGNIDERTSGGVTVTGGGTVEGNLVERGEGSILIDGQSLLTGDVREKDSGDVEVVDATVEGSIDEKSHGDVLISAESLVTGDLLEKGPGEVSVTDSTIEGDIQERGPGAVAVLGTSLVEGNVTARGPGDVTIDDTSTVVGDVEPDGEEYDWLA